MPINTNARFTNISDPVYQPDICSIWNITNSEVCVITTTQDGSGPQAHGYLSGLIVRLIVPQYWGMTQVNQLEGIITVLSDTTFSMDIDTSLFDPFVIPSVDPNRFYQVAQVIPIGEVNTQLRQAVRNVLPPLAGLL